MRISDWSSDVCSSDLMTLAGLAELVRRIDPEARTQGSAIQFHVQERTLILVGDEHAGRMRIMTPIARTDALDAAILQRMLQADFDAVLDARYAIANGIVWSVFIHPLPPMDFELDDDEQALQGAQIGRAHV